MNVAGTSVALSDTLVKITHVKESGEGREPLQYFAVFRLEIGH